MNEQIINDIKAIYGYFLYRAPDEEGLSYWGEKLASDDMSFLDVAHEVKNSSEATVKEAMQNIAGLYRGLLGRQVDAEGLNFWVQEFKTGSSINEIASGIRNSTEGLSKHQSSSDFAGLVEDLYQNLFNRSADPEGSDYWQNKLANGAEFSDIASEMASYANSRVNQDGQGLNCSNIRDYLSIRDEYKTIGAKILMANAAKNNLTSNQMVGTDGPDTINGTSGDDYIYGKGSGDKLNGNDGNDYIEGNDGEDQIHGGPGEDIALYGGIGDDWIYGDESGANNIDGGDGDDNIYPGPHTNAGNNNVIQGGSGDDYIYYDATVWVNSNHRDMVDGGTGTNYLMIEHFGGESINYYPEWASRIDTLWFSTVDSDMTDSFTVYLHQGTGLSRVVGLTTGFWGTISNFKLIYQDTPFNKDPVHEFSYIETSYIHASPVDDVKNPGDWFSYKIGKDSHDGYLTYYDEVVDRPVTIELDGYYMAGSVSNGSIVM